MIHPTHFFCRAKEILLHIFVFLMRSLSKCNICFTFKCLNVSMLVTVKIYTHTVYPIGYANASIPYVQPSREETHLEDVLHSSL